MNDSPILITVSDEDYMPYAEVLYKSFRKHNKHDFLLYAINSTPSFTDDYVPILSGINTFSTRVSYNITHTHKKGWCVNFRTYAIEQALYAGYSQIVFVDADSIINSSLDILFRQIKRTDIMAHSYGSKLCHLKVLCGVMGFNNNARTLKFVADWNEWVDFYGRFKYFSDQLAFSRARYANEEIEITQLGQHWIDTHFREKTAIWAGTPKGRNTQKWKTRLEELRN